MKAADYCSKVCKARCCIPDGAESRCPMLQPDYTCGIYALRYEVGLPWIWNYKKDGVEKWAECGEIEKRLAAGQMPESVCEICCYANPKVLEVDE